MTAAGRAGLMLGIKVLPSHFVATTLPSRDPASLVFGHDASEGERIEQQAKRGAAAAPFGAIVKVVRKANVVELVSYGESVGTANLLDGCMQSDEQYR
jgi:hypothetical protein